jgi:hypothetical protein
MDTFLEFKKSQIGDAYFGLIYRYNVQGSSSTFHLVKS